MGMNRFASLPPQFRERVLSAQAELRRGDTPAEVRERHGAIVLRVATEPEESADSRASAC